MAKHLAAISSLRDHAFDVIEEMTDGSHPNRPYGVIRELQRIAFELGQLERMLDAPPVSAARIPPLEVPA